MNARPLHFSAFIWPNGYHESAWRVVDDDVRGVLGLPYYAGIARVAERGLMDAIFLADNIAIAEYRATYLPQTQFDPISVLSALAAVTSDIGLIGTGSTTYSKPWELARRFATLDHLSGGRAGWNIVTTVTPLAAAAFGEPAHPDHADRYARAHEFVDATIRAWDSWEDDAVIGDREHGVWADRGKLHDPVFPRPVLRHRGDPALPPLPSRPPGARSGRAVSGWHRAGRTIAELVFSGPPSLEAAVAFGRPARSGHRRGPRPCARARPSRADGDARRHRSRSPGPGPAAGRAGEPGVPLAERAVYRRAGPRCFRPGRSVAR